MPIESGSWLGRRDMLNALIVADDPHIAESLRYYVELQESVRVVAIVDDIRGALETSRTRQIDLALVDIDLAHLASGYHVASELTVQGICCVFVASTLPAFAMPELALGCIVKPLTAEAVRSALGAITASLGFTASIGVDAQPVPAQNPGFLRY